MPEDEKDAAAKAEKDAEAAAAAKKVDDPDAELLQGAQNPDAVKNALRSEREAAKEARKKAEDLAARVKKFEDKDKSESEKAAEEKATAERRAAEAETKLMRFEVAAAKGLDPKWASRLAGSTKEELEADAEKLAKEITPSSPGFDGGARQSVPADDDMNDLIRRRAGRA